MLSSHSLLPMSCTKIDIPNCPSSLITLCLQDNHFQGLFHPVPVHVAVTKMELLLHWSSRHDHFLFTKCMPFQRKITATHTPVSLCPSVLLTGVVHTVTVPIRMQDHFQKSTRQIRLEESKS
ncbi:hypothetical protein DAI22_11g034833 [Oryza sativa Japonica Group]|nr:hypothetical protein DAI22_11g034833 [Oryza sativa Japonica Group]